MKTVIKSFIQQTIQDNDKNENLFIRAEKIRQSAIELNMTNCDIFEVLQVFENNGIIKINSIGSAGEKYADRANWIWQCDNFNRYIIDVLKSEYFNIIQPESENWALKVYADFERNKFVVKFNGLDSVEEITLKTAKGGKDSKLITVLKKFQSFTADEKNKYCKISDKECAKPRDTVREFFKRFCPDLQKHVIRFDRGGFDVHLFNVISPYSFQDKMSETLVFHDSNGYSRKYTCKFDEKGNFIGWQNA